MQVPVRVRSLIWLRFRRHRLALVGTVILAVLVILAVFALQISGHDPYKIDLTAYRAALGVRSFVPGDLARVGVTQKKKPQAAPAPAKSQTPK